MSLKEVMLENKVAELEGQLLHMGSAIQSQMMNVLVTLREEDDVDGAIEMLEQICGVDDD